MKEKFIASVVNLAKRKMEYTEEEVAIMRYALEGIYLTFTKILVITLIAALLGLFKEYNANINIENVSKIILVILFIVIILNVYGISIKARIDTTQHSLVVLACQPKLTLLIGV